MKKWIATDKSGQTYIYDSKPVMNRMNFYQTEGGDIGSEISTGAVKSLIGYIPSKPVSIEVRTKAKPKILQLC